MNYRYTGQLKEKLENMSKMSFDQIKKEDLTDINDIKIDRSLKPKERIMSYLSQVKNPYFLKKNGIAIKIGFSDSGKLFSNAWRTILCQSCLSIKNKCNSFSYGKYMV